MIYDGLVTVTSTSDTYLTRIGTLIRDARRHQGLTQSELADLLGTSQSAVARIEQGKQNLSLEMLARVGEKLDSEFVSLGHSGPQHLRIVGGQKLSGSIPVKTSKNAAVALLCASLLNKGRTTLRSLARIEEVNRIIEVLTSIGVKVRWLPGSNDLEIIPPARIDLDSIDVDAARRTRTVIMFFGPLLHELGSFQLPYAGGCDLGTRTVEPHLSALKPFGLDVAATHGFYEATVDAARSPERAIVLTERGDTVTENALMAAARNPGTTIIRNASPQLHGPGPVLLPAGARRDDRGHRVDHAHGHRRGAHRRRHRVLPLGGPDRGDEPDRGGRRHRVDDHHRAGADRVPRDRAGHARGDGAALRHDLRVPGDANGHTRLVDLTIHPSELKAPVDKIAPMPFPGLNIDNLPFFALIAAWPRARR
jgi:UDP-N-acetylglucosamine 1-carboxyvinyltransferase